MKFRLALFFIFYNTLLFSENIAGIDLPTLEVDKNTPKTSLLNHMLIIKDEGYDVDKAVSLFENQQGKLVTKSKIGVSKGTYWFYFNIRSKNLSDYIFTINGWTHTFMAFYLQDENSQSYNEIIQWQDNLYHQNKKSIHNFNQRVELKKNTHYNCLLKIAYPRNIYIPLFISSIDKHYETETQQQLNKGLLYGTFSILFIVIIILYFELRDPIYFYYGGVVVFTAVYSLFQDGILYQWFSKILNIFYVEFLLQIGYTYFTTFFVLKFNNLQQYFPKLYKGFIIWIGIIFILLSSFFLTEKYVFFIIGNYLKDFSFIFFWILTLILFKKNSYVRYYSIVYGIYVLTCFLFLLSFNAGLSIKITITTIKYVATAKMIIMLGLTIYRFKKIQKEKEKLVIEKQQLTQKTSSLLQENTHLTTEKKQLIKELSHKDKILTSFKTRENTNANFQDKRKQIYNLFDVTKRELDIIEKLLDGKPNKQVAEELNVSLSTVKQYSSRVYKKLNVASRVELITFIERL